jgi:hypothetical protein
VCVCMYIYNWLQMIAAYASLDPAAFGVPR